MSRVTRGITPLVAPHYSEQTPDGRTVVRAEPPGVAVLHEDGTVALRHTDEPGHSRTSLEDFMASPPPQPPPIECDICKKLIDQQDLLNGPVRHGDGMAHSNCQDAFVDDLVELHPPRGHRPRPRG